MQLCFATHNANKIKEVNQALGEHFEVQSLDDLNIAVDIPETQKTLEGNSLQKARFVYDNYGADAFADDTGLEVFVLDGEPGVYSARYAGPEKDSEKNIKLLLEKLEGKKDRRAQFKTVFTLVIKGKTKQFEGIVKGKITEEPSGKQGFGYDPVFIPDGHDCTFAEMSLEQKNSISHRGKAVQKLIHYLQKHYKTEED